MVRERPAMIGGPHGSESQAPFAKSAQAKLCNEFFQFFLPRWGNDDGSNMVLLYRIFQAEQSFNYRNEEGECFSTTSNCLYYVNTLYYSIELCYIPQLRHPYAP